MSPKDRGRATHLHVSDFERLEEWGRLVRFAFDGEDDVGLFVVGSVLERPDFRDVDVRLMLTDTGFDQRWADLRKVRYMNRAISTWGRHETGLPIDFQIQRMTEANAQFSGGARNPIGLRDWATTPTSGVPKPKAAA